MICSICKKTDQEVALYQGILRTKMVKVCEECAEDQKIPIIKKPSSSQLSKADKTYTVRERLTRMSGRRDTTDISDDQIVTQKNLARLRMPRPKQTHPDVVENYYWEISMARRRLKMTLSQLAKKIDTPSYIVQEIERGILPKGFKDVLRKLENFLGIKLLKTHDPEISYTRKNPEHEKEILAAVAARMKNPEADLQTEEDIEESEELIEDYEPKQVPKVPEPRTPKSRLSKTQAEIRLSRREDLSNVTLNDLVDRKRQREKYEQQLKQDEMLGDEIDLEEL